MRTAVTEKPLTVGDLVGLDVDEIRNVLDFFHVQESRTVNEKAAEAALETEIIEMQCKTTR